MKKITLNLGLISAVLFCIGVLLKWQHWPGAGVALVISITLFAAGYAPLLYMDRNRAAQSSHQKLANLIGLIASIVISVSFLFKVMHWPGAGIGVGIGNLMLIVLVLTLFYRASKESEAILRMNAFNEAILLLFLTGFSLFLWLVMG